MLTKINVNELKTELTKEEQTKILMDIVNYKNFYFNNVNYIPLIKAREKQDAATVADLLQVVYVSKSIQDHAAALFMPNINAEIVGLRDYALRAVTLDINNNIILLITHKKTLKEVFIKYDQIGEFIKTTAQQEREQNAKNKITQENATRQRLRELLPQAVTIINKYVNKPLGEKTRREIWLKLRELDECFYFSTTEYNSIQNSITISYKYFSFYFDCYDYQQNKITTPLELSAKLFEKIQQIDFKTHRAKLKKVTSELEKSAAKISALIDEYNTLAHEAGIKIYPKTISKYNLALTELNAEYLDKEGAQNG